MLARMDDRTLTPVPPTQVAPEETHTPQLSTSLALAHDTETNTTDDSNTPEHRTVDEPKEHGNYKELGKPTDEPTPHLNISSSSSSSLEENHEDQEEQREHQEEDEQEVEEEQEEEELEGQEENQEEQEEEQELEQKEDEEEEEEEDEDEEEEQEAQEEIPNEQTSTSNAPRPILMRNVSFSLNDEVREFSKTKAEIAFEREAQEESYQMLLNRWRNKGKKVEGEDDDDPDDDLDPKASKIPDCREIRIITLNRGKELRPIGISLSIKPAVTPETGTVAIVNAIDRNGLAATSPGKHKLRVGDQILKVWDSSLADIEPGQFLAMIQSPSLELVVFSPADAKAKQEQIKIEREQIENERFENRRKLEELKRERANAQLQQERIEDIMMRTWIKNYKAHLTDNANEEESWSEKDVDEGNIFRTVYLDRRKDKSKPITDTLDRKQHFEPQPKDKLVPLGISLFIRPNMDKNGKPNGTFAVISDVFPDMLAANSGRGRNQLWPDDRIIKVQGRDLTSFDPLELVNLLNAFRVELVVANVARYEQITRTPDFIDDIGHSIDAISSKLGAIASRVKDRWGSKKKVSDDFDGVDFGSMDEFAPKKPNLDLFYVPAPIVHSNSSVISGRNWCRLWEMLPKRIQFKEARCCFNSSNDGYSLQHLYTKTANISPFLLVLETKTHSAFGVYMTAPLLESGRHLNEYRGTGESFLFKLAPEFKKYPWTGVTNPGTVASAPKMFMHATPQRLSFGGGGNGHAIEVDDDLRFGQTRRGDTYANDPLCPDSAFECMSVEFWGFSENMSL